MNRDFLILIAMGFCFVATDLFLLISSAGYMQDEFGASPSVSAVANTLFLLGALGARVVLGPRIDGLGRRNCLFFAGLLGCGSCLLYPYCADLYTFCAVRALHGAFYGVGLLCANSMVASVVPAKRRAEGLGLFMLSYTLASALSPYMSMYLEYDGNYGLIFQLAALCCLVPMVLSLMLRSGRPIRYEEGTVQTGNKYFEPTALRITSVLLVFGVSYSSLLTFTSVYGESIHLESAMVNFYLVEAVATFLSRTLLAKIPDRYGDNITLIPCFIIYSISLFVFAWVHSPASIYFCGAAMGFIIAYMNAVGQSIAIRRVGPERYSVCISMFQNFYDIALAFGPIMLGAVADARGYPDMYVVAGVISVISMIMYIFLHGITKYRLKYGSIRSE
ncbi:MAG: MFS transporter [archaeon]|nr:MFS transporter [archaeon]